MALIYPFFLQDRRESATPALYGYEYSSAAGFRARAMLCRLHLSRPEEGIVFPAQQPAISDGPVGSSAMPVMMFDGPASTLENLLFAPNARDARIVSERRDESYTHHLTAITDLHAINIVCTELQEKRLILAGNDAAWSAALERSQYSMSLPRREHKVLTTPIHPRGYLQLQPPRPDDATPVMLVNEEGEFAIAIRAIHRIVPQLPGFHAQRFLDQARLFFQIEHLPSALTPERVEYLLTRGNELGPAMIGLVAGEGYLLKARLDVIDAIFSPEKTSPAGTEASVTPDIGVLELLLRRAVKLELSATQSEYDVPSALAAARAGAPLTFCLNPPTLPQIQRAALLRQPLPADTFCILPQPPEEWIQDVLGLTNC